MKRRNLLSLAAAATLAGCGFKLRQAPDFAFDTILVNAASTSSLAAELRRKLAANGKVKVLETPVAAGAPLPAPATLAEPEAPPVAVVPANPGSVILDVLLELREKVVVGMNASGQVREFQLRTRLRFKLRTAGGKDLIPDTELLQQRDISFNESSVLAKESEESLLYRDMQSDLVQQLMRRLAAIKVL
jgi:LPS-assembly lipoprotein